MTETAQKSAAKPAASPWLKLTLELGPLLLFFFANARPKLFEPFVRLFVPAPLLTGENAGLFTATSVLIPAVLLALVVSYLRTRHLPIMPLVTAILVVIFGALTLYLHDPSFIKMKPTILYAVFGLALIGGLRLQQAAAADRARQCDRAQRRGLAHPDLALGALLLHSRRSSTSSSGARNRTTFGSVSNSPAQ